MQAGKRRYTAAFASEGNASPEKGVKRSKTLRTYGASRRQIESANDTNFDHFRDDHSPTGTSSQTVRFSEHSGHQSSMPLPAGSLQTGFLSHEPALMFKDTGDTIADASSEQQRLYEQAIALKKGQAKSVAKGDQQISEHESSSIPWTASDTANSTKSKKSQIATQGGDEARGGLGEPNDGGLVDGGANANTKQPAVEDPKVGDHWAPQLETLTTNEPTARKPKSSPMVEIPRHESERHVTLDEPVKSTQRGGKKRNREAEEEGSEPLKSEDRAVGLPKERYQPRPSKRRATHVIEELIDYSVRPEKAAKAKRTKSAGANVVGGMESAKFDVSPQQEQAVNSPRVDKDHVLGEVLKGPITADDEQDESPLKPRRRIKQPEAEEPSGPQSTPSDQAVSQDKSKVEAQDDDDKIFVKPAIPTPKPKSTSKVKRAQTTIFEDHVEFVGSRRSPNLSQQQAKRKSALQDVKNEVVPKSQRKRKSVVADDSDDEDELAKENDAAPAKTESPPKKRRGRPPKQAKQTQPKATDSVLKNSDEDGEEGEEAQAEAEKSEVEAPPKKRGRGRPPKAASKTAPAPEVANDEPMAGTGQGNNTAEPSNGATDAPPQSESTPSKPNASATKMPTPSPDRPTEKANATPQKAATSAAQHSPIKSSSKVPLRVGLSKRHRIPSLLRITRPPKR